MALCGRGFGLARHLLQQLRRVLSTGDHLGVGRPGRSLERLRDGSRCVLHGWTPDRHPTEVLPPHLPRVCSRATRFTSHDS